VPAGANLLELWQQSGCLPLLFVADPKRTFIRLDSAKFSCKENDHSFYLINLEHIAQDRSGPDQHGDTHAQAQARDPARQTRAHP
jgi:hypothetical protein